LIAAGGGGFGWKSLQSAALGGELRLRGPVGDFTLRESGRSVVFVATGTGIAPMLPMLEHIANSQPQTSVVLFFGSRHRGESLLTECLKTLPRLKQFRTIHCLSAEETAEQHGECAGRVTDGLRAAELDWANSDLYVAGNPEMVRDVCALAFERGATAVYAEHY
jgi:NAD(P)H-flavin reductase